MSCLLLFSSLSPTALADPPELATPIDNLSVSAASTALSLNLSTNFTDPDGDALTYTANLSSGAALPAWLNFNAAVPSFSGIPFSENVGTFDLVVIANDGSASVSDTFALTVIAAVTGPGGVGANNGNSALELWLDANAGITGTAPVTGVTDQSGNGVTLTVSGNPALNTGSVNSVDAITFDGTGDFLTTNLSINAGSVPRLSVLAVHRPRVNDAGVVWGERNPSTLRRLLIDNAAGNVNRGIGGLVDINNLFTTGSYSLSTVVHQEDVANGSEVYVNGLSDTAETFTSNHAPLTTTPLRIASLDAVGGLAFDGDIAELLVYSDTLTAAQRIIAENYLSAKYGLSLADNDLYTMDNAGSGNYDFNVAGIGVAADSSALLEARGTGIVSIRRTTLPSDSTFLFWGDNGQAVAFTETSDVLTGFGGRLARVWRVSEIGDLGNISMRFDLSGIDLAVAGGDIRLALSANSVFTSVDDTLRGSFNAGTNTLTFADVDLPDSIYFTLFQPRTQPPVVANAIADIAIDEDAAPDTIVLSNVFSDPENDPLTFSLVNSNTSLLLAALSNDTLYLNYAADSSGTAQLTVSALDGSSGSVSDAFTVTVNAVNDAPRLINPIADVFFNTGSPFTLALSTNFSDPEGDAITYTANLADGSALPSWLSFDADVPSFSGVPFSSDVGALEIVLAARDAALTSTETFTLTVINSTTGPGGIGSTDGRSNLDLWFDANAGITGTAPITSVTDQSGNGITLTVNGDPALNASSVNSVNAITFDGTGDFLTSNLRVNAGTVPRVTLLSVYRPRVNNAGAVWGEDNGGFDRFLIDDPTATAGNNSVSSGTGFVGNITDLFVTGNYSLSTVVHQEDVTDGSAVYVSGGLARTFTSNHAPETSNPLQIATIGASNLAFNGDIAEVLVYGDTLSLIQRIITENYLSAKYGLSLAANDLYTMDNAANGNYDFNVAGIGVAADGSAVLEARGTGIISIRRSMVPADSTFLFWGDNGRATNFTEFSDVLTGFGGRLGSIWRVSEIGDMGSINMRFDLSDIDLAVSGADIRLALSANSVFTSVDDTLRGSFNADSGTLTFADVNLSNGQYFTLFQPSTQPPVLANAIADLVVDEDDAPDTIVLSNVFSDPENNPLTFSTVNSNTGLLLAAVSNDTLYLNYAADSNGTARLIVSAIDGSSGSVSDTFNVTVNAVNDAPRLINLITDVSVDARTVFSLALSTNFADPDDAITYTANLADGSALPSWLSFNAADPSFSGFPFNSDAGTLDIVLLASDAALTSSDTFTLTVTAGLLTGGPGGIGSTDGRSDLDLWFDANAGITGTAPITGVTDQSGNGITFTVSGDPALNAGSVNGVDAITFDATGDFLTTSLRINAGSVPRVTVLSVYRPRTNGAGAVWGESNSNAVGTIDRILTDQNSVLANNSVSSGTRLETNITNLFVTGRYSLSTVVHQEDVTGGSAVYVSGRLARTFRSNHAPDGSNPLQIAALGLSNGNLFAERTIFDGDIAEVLVYSDTLSTVQRVVAENYLSAKYGLPLAANDLYTMDNAASGNYDFNVAGIGAAADGSAVLEARGTGIVSMGRRTAPSDGTFLFWGDNGQAAAFTETSDVPAVFSNRLSRVWRVSEAAGDIGSINMSFDLSDIDLAVAGGDIRLALDNDGVFASVDDTLRGSFNAATNILTFADVNLPDSMYFTLFQPAKELPVVVNAIADITVNENADPDTIILSNVFFDPENDPLTFSAVSSNTSLVLAEVSNDTLQLRYAVDSSGTARLIVSANDISSGSVSDTFNLTVNPLNSVPRLVSPIADVSATTGNAFSLTLSTNFTDPEGDAITYTANLADGSALPAWLSFDAAVPSFSGTPFSSDIGTLDIVLLASDASLTGTDTFTLTVIPSTGPGGIGTTDGSSDLNLWFDANAGITGTAPITGITDQSGNEVSFTVSGDPTLNASSVNGVDAITFDGTGDFLTTDLSINADSIPRLSVLAVYRPRVNGAQAVWGEDNGDFDRFLQDHPTAAAGNNSVSSGTGFVGDITDLFVTANYSLSTVVHQEDVTGGSAVYVSGGLARMFTSNHAPETSNPLQIAAIGAGGSAFDGDIAEVLVYGDTLSLIQRIIAENYLSAKYGLSLAANDLYTMDNAASGNYDFNVAGIGAAADGSAVLEARGTGIVSVGRRTAPSDSTFLFWGDNGQAAAFTEDFQMFSPVLQSGWLRCGA